MRARSQPARFVATTTRALLVAVLAASPLVLAGALPSPASADELIVSPILDTTEQSVATATVPVPDGVVPTAIQGTLDVPDPATDPLTGTTTTVTFGVGDRDALTVPATSTPLVTVPVTSADVGDDGTIVISMTYGVSAACPDGAGAADLRLTDLALVYTGSETAPTTAEDFFPTYPSRIDVTLPERAPDDLLEAGLVAVGALSARFPGVPVAIASAAARLPRTGPGQRVLRLKEGGTSRVTESIANRFGLETLELRGSDDLLLDRVRALGLRPGEESLPSEREVGLSRTFDELRPTPVVLSGATPSFAELRILQDAFGEPVDSLHIVATGTHTALPDDAGAQLNTYLNDQLLDSQLLDDSPDFDIDVTADGAGIGTVNTLRFSVSTDGGDAGCGRGTALPVEVYLDGAASSVTATPATETDTGFDVYPQALEGELTVAIRPSGKARLEAAANASRVLSALQNAAAAPLTVTLTDADEFVGGTGDGLLVGATYEDSSLLGAPLRYTEVDPSEYPDGSFGLDRGTSFAALEAVPYAERRILTLGSWGRPRSDDPATLSRTATEDLVADGWTSLTGDVVVSSGDAEAEAFDSGIVAPPSTPAEGDTDTTWWFVGGIAALVLLLVYQVVRTVRRERAARDDTAPDSPDPDSPDPDSPGPAERRVST